MTFTHSMERAAQPFEVCAVAVLGIGLIAALVSSARLWHTSGDGRRAYTLLRAFFGGVLLLAVEILVAADLIRTVAVTSSLESVGALGLIVLIRTFLSFSLETEIEGVPTVASRYDQQWHPHDVTCGSPTARNAAVVAPGQNVRNE